MVRSCEQDLGPGGDPYLEAVVVFGGLSGAKGLVSGGLKALGRLVGGAASREFWAAPIYVRGKLAELYAGATGKLGENPNIKHGTECFPGADYVKTLAGGQKLWSQVTSTALPRLGDLTNKLTKFAGWEGSKKFKEIVALGDQKAFVVVVPKALRRFSGGRLGRKSEGRRLLDELKRRGKEMGVDVRVIYK